MLVTDYETSLLICSNLLDSAQLSERRKIETYFDLGRHVDHLIQDGRYGDGIVAKLAQDLTIKRGRPVYPQRLYECRAVYLSFKYIDKIWELESKLGCDITWGYLIKNCIRKPNHKEGQAYTEHWEKKLTTWEHTISEIEKAKEELPHLPSPVREQVEGFLSYASLNVGSDFQKAPKEIVVLSPVKEPKGIIRFPKERRIEDPELAELLKSIITYDEVTGDALAPEDREIHHIIRSQGGGDTLDNMLVISHKTHIGDIHNDCLYSKGELREIVHKRNMDLLAKILKSGDVSVTYLVAA